MKVGSTFSHSLGCSALMRADIVANIVVYVTFTDSIFWVIEPFTHLGIGRRGAIRSTERKGWSENQRVLP